MIVQIPATAEHMGIHSITVTISDLCPKCGAKRGTERWRGFSYDGSRRLGVDCWSNECGHVDSYTEVRAEVAAAAK